ncbi:MAG: PKD domain-containing protein [Bacteroidetes bacterium OLB12]|nr:MAG: PKD domain-containing protein [Bacteroidetes bacterium OLB12]
MTQPSTRSLLFAIFAIVSSLSAIGQNQTARLTPQNQIGYYEYLPPGYESNTDLYPVVFFFHGMGERGNGTTELAKIANLGPPRSVRDGYKFPFILISPQLKSSYGVWPSSYIDEVVEHARSYLRIDPSRMYFTGLSLGGGGTWEYVATYPQKVAAAVPVCGGYNTLSKACIYANNNIPIWASHGDKDGVVPMARTVNMINAINACVPAPNPAPILTIYPNVAHNAWNFAYRTDNSLHTPNVFEWMMGFRKGGVSVSAGLDVVLNLPTNSVNITGVASTSSGTITSYDWVKVSGPSATINNASSITVSLSNLITGVYTFRLTVTNSLGQTNSDLVKVTVVSGNQNPVANAGPDRTLTLPTNSLTITGSGSDSGGSIASYAWTKVSGPTATINGQNTATLSLSSLVAGTYVFTLTVTDNLGSTGSDNVTVTVNPAATNQAPVANAGPDKSINLPTSSTTLPGSGTDADGTVTTYLWEKVSGPTATLANINTNTLSVSGLTAGVYVFRLTVTDNTGATASDQVTLTVIDSNQAPVANAGGNVTVTLPTNSTNLIGSGSDADGSVASYAWTQVSGPSTATFTNATNPTVTVSNLLQGSYVFRLTVTDDDGATGTATATVTVVNPATNKAPFANAGPDRTITLPVNSVVLTGTANDLDGTIASYSWSKLSGPTATLTNQNTNVVTISDMIAGTYLIRLTVTDNLGATATDNVSITVNPAVVNQSPTVDAGANQAITLPVNNINLSATANDPDGTIATYLWEKVTGPSATLSGSSTQTLAVTAMLEGVYVFRVTVTDNLGATASDEVTVTVTNVNQAPVVVASNDVTITLPTNSTTLTAVASDPDGSIANYLWTNTSGPSSPTMSGITTATLDVSNLVAGTYIFKITVTDNESATAFDNVTVVVQSATNQTPIANAGADQSITLPTNSTNFVGSGLDSDGSIASYQWTQISGGAITLTNANTSSLTVSGAVAGTYIFRLTVTDDDGATGLDDVTLTVNPAAVNQVPIVSAGSNQTISLPQNSLNLTGSGSDPDGSIASYLWSKVSGPTVVLTNQNTPVVSLSNLLEGTYTFRLTVTDNLGATAQADVTVTVLPAVVNQPPVSNAGADIILTLPTNSTTLFGAGSDPDGTIVTYNWIKVSGPAATLANETTATLSVSDLVEGVYVFRLNVTDEDLATSTDEMTLTVNGASVNQLPTANAGTNITITLPTNAATLNGSGSDPDGSIASYAWTKLSGPTFTAGATNAPALSLTNLVQGIYIFELEVTDDDGATATDQVTVTVNPAAVNQPPVVDAGADHVVFLPTNSVQLTGTATDADGTVASVLWTKVSGPAGTTFINDTGLLPTINGLTEGVFIFRLTATDDKGATAFDEIKVTVNAATVNQPPSANAGSDKTIKLPTNSTTLPGLGLDPDGTIASYAWTKISGPTVVLANQNTNTLSLSNMVDGSYTFQLTVTDNDGDTGSDQVTVLVLPADINTPPVANAGPDVNVLLPNNTAILVGSATDDGTVASTSWVKVSGPPAFLTNPLTTTLTASNLIAGTYLFRLTVTDDGGLTATDDATVIVFPENPPNQPPVVSAGDDQMIQLPVNSITLVAVAEDPDGIIDVFAWSQLQGPATTVTTDNTNELVLTDLAAGTYSFVVTVTDNEGLTASSEVTLVVREEDPVAKPLNTFSPNGKGDPATETWHIANADLLADCDIVVYNRQGVKVFESRGYDTEWNGYYNGKLLPAGVYFYVISCAGGKTQNGSVTLIR